MSRELLTRIVTLVGYEKRTDEAWYAQAVQTLDQALREHITLDQIKGTVLDKISNPPTFPDIILAFTLYFQTFRLEAVDSTVVILKTFNTTLERALSDASSGMLYNKFFKKLKKGLAKSIDTTQFLKTYRPVALITDDAAASGGGGGGSAQPEPVVGEEKKGAEGESKIVTPPRVTRRATPRMTVFEAVLTCFGILQSKYTKKIEDEIKNTLRQWSQESQRVADDQFPTFCSNCTEAILNKVKKNEYIDIVILARNFITYFLCHRMLGARNADGTPLTIGFLLIKYSMNVANFFIEKCDIRNSDTTIQFAQVIVKILAPELLPEVKTLFLLALEDKAMVNTALGNTASNKAITKEEAKVFKEFVINYRQLKTAYMEQEKTKKGLSGELGQLVLDNYQNLYRKLQGTQGATAVQPR